MKQIPVSNGDIIDFPDEMSDDAIEKILRDHYGSEQKKSTFVDFAKSVGSGIAGGVSGLAGLAGDAANLGYVGGNWVGNKLGLPPLPAEASKNLQQTMPPSSADIQRRVEKFTGPFYKPQTPAGEHGRTIGEFLPAAIAGGGGSVLGNALRYGVVPAVASEFASNKVKGTEAEPWVRGGTALAAGGLAAALSRPRNAMSAVSQSMGGIDDQTIYAAQKLIEDSANRGINLAWPQAISSVNEGAMSLQRLQRFVERTPAGNSFMSEFYRGQPENISVASSRQFDTIAPLSETPSLIGPRAQMAAQGTLSSVQRAINEHTRPLYEAAREQTVNLPGSTTTIPEKMTAAQYREFSTAAAGKSPLPALDEAIKIARSDPIIGPTLANLPDNSIGVIDAAQKVMRSMGRRASMDEKFPYKESLIGGQRQQAIDTATRANPDYALARAAQTNLRGDYLEPLQAGPLGRIAESKNTQGAIENLFGPKLAGGEGEIAKAVGGMEKNIPGSASNLIRQHLANQQNTAMGDLVSGGNYYGGAKLAKALMGNPQAAKDLEASITSTVNGADKWAGVKRLAEILGATGQRLPEGSATATDLGMVDALKGMQGPIAKTIGILGQPGKILGSAIDDTYGMWRYKKSSEQLAKILTDPASADMLIRLGKSKIGSPMSAAIVNALMAGENVSSITSP